MQPFAVVNLRRATSRQPGDGGATDTDDSIFRPSVFIVFFLRHFAEATRQLLNWFCLALVTIADTP
jgi:hypothetical protein